MESGSAWKQGTEWLTRTSYAPSLFPLFLWLRIRRTTERLSPLICTPLSLPAVLPFLLPERQVFAQIREQERISMRLTPIESGIIDDTSLPLFFRLLSIFSHLHKRTFHQVSQSVADLLDHRLCLLPLLLLEETSFNLTLASGAKKPTAEYLLTS